MVKKLAYKKWKNDLPAFAKIVRQSDDKKLVSKIKKLEKSSETTAEEKKDFVNAATDILENLDYKLRDKFYAIDRNREYMEEMTSIRVKKSTRERLRKLMVKLECDNYEEAVNELIKIYKKSRK